MQNGVATINKNMTMPAKAAAQAKTSTLLAGSALAEESCCNCFTCVAVVDFVDVAPGKLGTVAVLVRMIVDAVSVTDNVVVQVVVPGYGSKESAPPPHIEEAVVVTPQNCGGGESPNASI